MSLKDIYLLAPLQGFTDFIFRKCYHQYFGDIDEYYIPYISIGPGNKIRNSQFREIMPDNNRGIPVVPQILCGNAEELARLADEIKNFGYNQINLNLGCPYPMATNRGRGTGLLENPDMLKRVLDKLFANYDFRVSIKFRSGLKQEETIFEQLELLSSYPFEKMIYHPRTARQMYKGEANRNQFAEISRLISRPLVYNGDIRSKQDIDLIKTLVPNQAEWMIGRGILSNPFLIRQIEGNSPDKDEQTRMKQEFHQLIFDEYKKVIQDEGHLLIKMKSFWSYYSGAFNQPQKAYKPIKKASSLAKFTTAYQQVFKQFD